MRAWLRPDDVGWRHRGSQVLGASVNHEPPEHPNPEPMNRNPSTRAPERPTNLRPLLIVVACLTAAAGALAQYGHPLKGSWSGDWGPNKEQRTRVLLDMQWDGKTITGAINPGPNALPLTKATLDPATWLVHLEAGRKESAGKIGQVVIDATLQNIGSSRRVLSGTWTEGGRKGDVRLVRN